MALKEAIERVLAEYPAAKQQPFSGHELADFLRHGFPEVLQSIIASVPGSVGTDYIVKGSAGQSQWYFVRGLRCLTHLLLILQSAGNIRFICFVKIWVDCTSAT